MEMGGSRDNRAYQEILAHRILPEPSIYDTVADHEFRVEMPENSIYQHLS